MAEDIVYLWHGRANGKVQYTLTEGQNDERGIRDMIAVPNSGSDHPRNNRLKSKSPTFDRIDVARNRWLVRIEYENK